MTPRLLPEDARLADRMRRQCARTCQEYRLLVPDMRVLVAVSGGKDSLCLLDMLVDLKRRAPFSFHLAACTLDPGFSDFDAGAVGEFCRQRGVEYRLIREDLVGIIGRSADHERLPCVMCARLRRGVLYTHAAANGFDAIALGHHQDDIIETLLLNLFYNARIAAMPPRLVSDDGRNVVIRPLAAVPEAWTSRLAVVRGYPVQEPRCPLTSGGKAADSRRRQVKDLIAALERDNPHLRSNLFSALSSVNLRHLHLPPVTGPGGDA